jgi:hypothetical protein
MGTQSIPPFAPPGNASLGDGIAEGSAVAVARSDHRHGLAAGTAGSSSNPGDLGVSGSANYAARSDHKHGREQPSTLGTLAFARVTASQGPTAPSFDITNATVTVTLVSGRRYRISAQALITSSVGTDGVQLAIVEGATDVMLSNETQPAAGAASGSNRGSVVRACPGDIAAGSVTYKLSARRNGGGTGNFTNNAGAAFPTWILVEDIGT